MKNYKMIPKITLWSLLALGIAFIALFFFGVAQCWLYRKTDRIWCPMLNHALFNLTNVVLLLTIGI